MSKSLAFPLRPNGRGGLATEDNLHAIIALGLLPGISRNPYNDRDGLSPPSFVWEPQTPEAEAHQLALVRTVFKGLEGAGRARLIEAYRRRRSGSVAEIVVTWENLQTGSTDETVLPQDVGG